MAESYAALGHLALNAERPASEWLNMGDWSTAQTFPTACRGTQRASPSARAAPT